MIDPRWITYPWLLVGFMIAGRETAGSSKGTEGFSSRPAIRDQVLYSFQGGTDGRYPQASLTSGRNGALYGTTTGGGSSNCGFGCGVVFKLTPTRSSYSETVLYRFQGGSDGANPQSSLVGGNGVLYGTTFSGGSGWGTIYKLTPSKSGYVETVVHTFQNGVDGADPSGGLLLGKRGEFFGTTAGGGSPSGHGTVFKLTVSGSHYMVGILHTFQGEPTDGNSPTGNLLADANGDLFGVTVDGGPSNIGTVFKLTPSHGRYVESVIHGFGSARNDGAGPYGGLVADANGGLYGTTNYGGKFNMGTVFELVPAGSIYTEHILHSFRGGSDGAGPTSSVTMAQNGVIYGDTASGGTSGCGTVFRLTPFRAGYLEKVVYNFKCFSGGGDGGSPEDGLIADSAGSLYGTALEGGANNLGAVIRFIP